jgi:hypothetical protein
LGLRLAVFDLKESKCRKLPFKSLPKTKENPLVFQLIKPSLIRLRDSRSATIFAVSSSFAGKALDGSLP